MNVQRLTSIVTCYIFTKETRAFHPAFGNCFLECRHAICRLLNCNTTLGNVLHAYGMERLLFTGFETVQGQLISVLELRGDAWMACPPPLKMAATLIAQFWGSKVIPRIAPLKGDDLCCQRLQHGLCVLVLCHVYIFEKYMAMSLILSVTIQVYRHSCSRCCLPSLRNHAKFPENSNFNRFWLNHPCVIQTDGRVIA